MYAPRKCTVHSDEIVAVCKSCLLGGGEPVLGVPG